MLVSEALPAVSTLASKDLHAFEYSLPFAFVPPLCDSRNASCVCVTICLVPCLHPMVQFVWIYVLLWFLAQDAAKVLTYWVMGTYFKEDTRKDDVRLVGGKIAARIETDDRRTRLRGGGCHWRCTCIA